MQRALLFVGHGGIPSDFPRREVMELKRLEAERYRSGTPVTPAEAAIDSRVRHWPRTPATDPYQHGFETLAEAVRRQLPYPVFIAYNEFCTPTIEQAIDRAYDAGYRDLVVTTTMVTPGGSHAALEIPEVLDACRERYPDLHMTYAWPFDSDVVAAFIVKQVMPHWPAND